jgi:hypothetical protein
VDRYHVASSLVIDGPAIGAALLGQNHAPLRAVVTARSRCAGHIEPGPRGCERHLSNGTGTIDSFPGSGPGPASVSQVVTAKRHRRPVHRAGAGDQRIGTADVVFTLTNLATAPASVTPADPSPSYTYSGASPLVRALVRNAAGQPWPVCR